MEIKLILEILIYMKFLEQVIYKYGEIESIEKNIKKQLKNIKKDQCLPIKAKIL